MFQSDRQECKNAPQKHGKLVEQIAGHMAVMQDRRIGESGVADAVPRFPRSPYTQTLLAALPRIARQ